MKFLFGVLAIAMLASPLRAVDLDKKLTGDVGYNIGNMVELPQGADKLYLTYVVRDVNAMSDREKMIATWFESDPRLAMIKSQCYWNRYGVSDPLYRDRLAYAVGTNAPGVIVQQLDAQGNGKVKFNATAVEIPATSAELADMLNAALADCCPKPTPPDNAPTPPNVTPSPAPIGPVIPKKPDLSINPSFTLGGSAALPVGAALAGIAVAYAAHRKNKIQHPKG